MRVTTGPLRSPGEVSPAERPGGRRRRWLAAAAVVAALVIIAVTVVVVLDDPLETPAATGVTQISLRDNAFDPPVVAIAPGTTMTWRWDDDGEQHNLVGDGWGVEVPQARGTFAHAFDEPGSYVYQCTLHFRMGGRIDVAAN